MPFESSHSLVPHPASLMGNSCHARVSSAHSDSSSDIDSSADYQLYKEPCSINSILGVDVNRGHPLYQYALFCMTRMAECYKLYLFPHIFMSLGSFREDSQDYIPMCAELYQDLSYDERTFVNDRVDSAADRKLKHAISNLAVYYWLRSTGQLEQEQPESYKQLDDVVPEECRTDISLAYSARTLTNLGSESMSMTSRSIGTGSGCDSLSGAVVGEGDDMIISRSLTPLPDSNPQMEKHPETNNNLLLYRKPLNMHEEAWLTDMKHIRGFDWSTADDDVTLITSYSDTVTLLITDLERKDIWQMSTLYNNQMFSSYLEDREPDVYRDLCYGSVYIEVPPLKKHNDVIE